MAQVERVEPNYPEFTEEYSRRLFDAVGDALITAEHGQVAPPALMKRMLELITKDLPSVSTRRTTEGAPENGDPFA